MKTVLLVPGSGEDITSRDYPRLIAAIESQGFNVVFVPISWPRTTINAWVAELDAIYTALDPAQTILAGFSFGAMTAFVAAAHRQPAELWLFSLSSYFSEDLESPLQIKSWVKRLGHHRISAFENTSFNTLARSLTMKTLLFYGRKELEDWPIMQERATAAQQRLSNSTLVTIDGVGHDVTNPAYIDAIINAI